MWSAEPDYSIFEDFRDPDLADVRPSDPVTWLAIGRLGAVMVPVNIAYTARELGYILDDSQAAYLVIAEEFLPTLDSVAGRPPALTDSHVIVVGRAAAQRQNRQDWQGLHDSGAPAFEGAACQYG